jgi:hypothetical protein
MRQRFPKHLYESDAEESDYDLTEKDLHPKSPKQGKLIFWINISHRIKVSLYFQSILLSSS